MDKPETEPWRPDPFHSVMFRPPETPREPMEFLSRSWSVSALEVSKALSPAQLSLSKPPNGGLVGGGGGGHGGPILEDIAGETEENATFSGNPFSFASSETSQMVMERIMSQSVSELSGAEHVCTVKSTEFFILILVFVLFFSGDDEMVFFPHSSFLKIETSLMDLCDFFFFPSCLFVFFLLVLVGSLLSFTLSEADFGF